MWVFWKDFIGMDDVLPFSYSILKTFCFKFPILKKKFNAKDLQSPLQAFCQDAQNLLQILPINEYPFLAK